ncbi:MAG: NAD-binding protein [Pseudomonadota bacterium]
MRIVIAGATRLGVVAAQQMIDSGHDVVLIDQDPAVLERLADQFDCGMLRGDATLPSTLRDAAGDGADVLLALTNSDEDNILAALVARSVGYERVVPQIVETELTAICEEMALKEFITPHATIARSLVESIEGGKAPEREAPLAGTFSLTGYDTGSAMIGRRVGDLDLDGDARVVAVTRGEVDRFAEPDLTIQEGDRLAILCSRNEVQAIHDGLDRQREQEGDE